MAWRWVIVGLVGLSVTRGAATAAEELWTAQRSRMDRAYRQELETLAAKCDELGFAPLARATREWCPERDPGRQYLFATGSHGESLPAIPDAALAEKWRARFLELRRARAAELFAASRARLEAGSGTIAYQLLHEVLHEDPGHAEARRVLAIDDGPESRPRSRAARLVHPQFGWPRGRWWQIESPHFQVATNATAEAGLELARRLEQFHDIWSQVCFGYWNSSAALQDAFEGRAVRPVSRRRHQAVLFRDRGEYIERLAAAEPQIAVTLGYYHKARQTSFFYAGDDSLVSVWHHEAAHQLFQETGRPVTDVGEKWNFWAVEGIAVYFESLTDRGTYFTLGGFDADRLQFARSRVLGGEPQLPVSELVRLGREELQNHADIRRLYTQSAGLTHFFLDHRGGTYRDRFIQFLADVYAGRDTPESLSATVGFSPSTFEAEWKSFLTVRSQDLAYLGPPGQRRNLSLLRADIDDDDLSRLAHDRQLEWLDLSFTPITAEALRHLAGLGKLKRLSLVGVRIGDEAAAMLTKLRQLEELDLSGTAVTDEGLGQLADMTRLKVLRVAHTAITDAGLLELTRLKQLEELDVEQTSVTAAAREQLKRQLPRLKL